MFYFIISKIPMISKIKEDKLFKIFIIGTICYIIIHTFLYSNYNTFEYGINYRQYIYYLWCFDLILTGIIVKLFSNSNDDLDEEITESSSSNNKILDDDLKKKVEEVKKYENKDKSPYPFIKKDNLNIDKSNNSSDKKINKELDIKELDKNHELDNNNLNKDNINEVELENQKKEYTDTDIPIYEKI